MASLADSTKTRGPGKDAASKSKGRQGTGSLSAAQPGGQSSPMGSTSTAPDPSAIRLAQGGLAPGGGSKDTFQNNTPTFAFNETGKDWRVRISVHPNSGVLYREDGASVLAPLYATDGVIFPYVPQLQMYHRANYNTSDITHSNYKNYFYQNSEVQEIQITGEFSAQSPADAEYVLAAITFFRAASKMFYGDSGKYQGSPPPVLYLDGYGPHYLPHVPCVLTSFNHTMPNDVDYIEVDMTEKSTTASASGSFTRIPTVSSIYVALQPIYSRARQKEFNFDAFARGDQLNKGFL
jgi:hypothetical protein